jgi:signal transduction histidine kinase/CheY-like chemotaxis protein/CHASE3 domain sensor protein
VLNFCYALYISYYCVKFCLQFNNMLNSAFKRKVLIGSTITLTIVLISAITSCLSVLSTRKSDAWETHTHEVINKIQDIELEIVNAETGLRGFIITGNEDFLVPYNDNLKQILPSVASLRYLVKDNKNQTSRIDSLEYYAKLKVQRMGANLSLYKKYGTRSPTLLLNTEQGRRYKAKISSVMAQLVTEEKQLLKERTTTTGNDLKRTLAIVIISSLTIFGLVIYLLTLIRKTFDFQKRTEEQVKERNERLAQLSFDREQQNRLMTAIGKVNDLMFGNQELEELASNVLNEVCLYSDVAVGAIFLLSDDKKLILKAGYAHQARSNNLSYDFGEGLVGQAAKEQQIRILDALPKHYIKVKSALGESDPACLFLIPIVNEHNTIAVLELGFLQKPNDEIREFLEKLPLGISIALSSAIARVTLRELFNQLQSQSEELESQQEELIKTNEELIYKSDQLQASEEELKIQQEELQQTNSELEEKAQQLEERNLAINQAKEAIGMKAEELETSSKYKSEFLANMSHELRTPLNSILILARILKENKAANLNEDQIKYAGVIQHAGTDLLNLINDILDLSKIESGKVELSIEAVRPVEICQNMEQLFSELAKSKHIQFETKIDGQLPNEFRSDSSRVEQIIKNLLSNAFKFTPEHGTIKLTFSASNDSTAFYSNNLKDSSDHMLSISVTDTGIGIPDQKQKLIFEAFQQADGSTSRKYGGTGLGLSISKELAALLGGEIQLHSSQGLGSTFTLYLPIKNQENTNTTALPQLKIPHADTLQLPLDKGKHTLLIVEDDLIFAKLLENYAVQKGYAPILAHDGVSALELAQTLIPHAIILDIFLPDTDGWTILKKLKADPITCNIPVHMMSSGEENSTKAELEGAIGFLKKPVDRIELNEAFELLTNAQSNNFKTVLIIEDQELQSQLVKEQLTVKGIEVCQAFNAKEALTILENQIFDCIILDLNLPDLPGLELLDKIKSQQRLAHIPVVINTAMELDQEKMTQIMKYSEAMVLKSTKSNERLMDEVSLFIYKLQHGTPQKKSKPVVFSRPIKPTNQEKVLQGKTVLMADDDMRNIFALSTAMNEYNINIIIANNGREALEKLEATDKIDLVLMDIMMPEMDGYEAMKRIRKQEKYSKLPIIALTAKAMKNDRQKCLDAGASDYISKPVEIDKLISMMRVWLS